MRKILRRFKTHKNHKNLLFLAGGVCAFLAGMIILWFSSLQIPDFHSFENRKTINSTKIYDRTGKILLYDIHQDVKKTEIPFEEMGTNIKNATVAIEDSEFYDHRGIRITSIIRAVLANLFSSDGRTQGGSTITQQLVKNTLLTQKKTIARKIKEWVLAIKIDRSMPKEKILEYYLNENPYGGNIYGIEEAAKSYFSKSTLDLTLAEAAYLASIPQSPTLLSPYGKNKNKLEARKNLVLQRMRELNFISQEEYDSAKGEEVKFIPQASQGIKAPHFVFFVKDYLEERYGVETVQEGGFKVTTTLDFELQQKAEEIVKAGALQNEKDWGGENAALVAIDPKTGQILSMVGSRDYFDKDIDGNYNVTTALRQPGSSFKPFIYATAFNKGFIPETVLFDLPTEFQTTCNPYGQARAGKNQNDCYMPQNYDGKFRGPMSLRSALAESINVVAVKLFYLSGLRDSLRTAESLGISSLYDINRYGLTLVIGGGEVSLLDMTSAYGVFANKGIRNPYAAVLSVEDKNGNVLESFSPRPEEVLPKNTALIISDILSDNAARTPTFGPNSSLLIKGKDVAVKTGTTNNNKDAWTIGYSPSIAVGVWAGNNDNKPMKKGGVSVAGPIWNRFMNEALKNVSDEEFEEPEEVNSKELKPVLRGYWQGNESFLVDKISGKLASEFTPAETTEEKIITNVHSILYWVDKGDILGPPPDDPSNNPQFENWETPIQNWWQKNKQNYQITRPEDIPKETDDVHKGLSSALRLQIIEPRNDSIHRPEERVQLRIKTEGVSKYTLQKIDVFINDKFVETLKYPFSFSFVPEEIEQINTNEENELKLVYYDSAYNRGQTSMDFKIEN